MTIGNVDQSRSSMDQRLATPIHFRHADTRQASSGVNVAIC